MAIGSNNPFPSVLVVEGSAPSSPASGNQRAFIDSADHHLKLKNSAGTVTDLQATSAGALVFLEAHTASASAQLDFTTFISSTYDTYKIEGVGIIPATNTAELRLQVGTGGGPTYDTGNNYVWAGNGRGHDGTAYTDNGSTGAGGRMCKDMSNNATYGFATFSLTATNLQSTAVRKAFQGTITYVSQTAPRHEYFMWGMDWITDATAVTALRFLMSSGNITSGTIRIYGVTKS